jgi:ATP-dependent DNA helicase RecG
MELIKLNPHITIVEIANQLNLTTRTIEKNIKLLRESGRLERIGADKGGYWNIK